MMSYRSFFLAITTFIFLTGCQAKSADPAPDTSVEQNTADKAGAQAKSAQKNAVEAMSLNELKQAAELGQVEAMYRLAGMYMDGNGVEQNDELGMKWTRQAALAGHLDARFELAFSKKMGNSISSIDEQTAKQWLETCAMAYQKAASSGDIHAMERLSWMYETGAGMPKNQERADMWQTEATRRKLENGQNIDPDELYNLGVAYFQGDVIEKDDKKAGEIFKLTAEMGLPEAQYSYGLFLTSGSGNVAPDDETAFTWYLRAAEQNHAQAQFEVAQRLYYGTAVTRDILKAAEWFEKSAKAGYTKSQLMLGMMYGKGEPPFEQDYKQAAYWLEQAKDDDEFPIGKSFLGMMYIQGNGVEQDKEKGMKLLREAAALGDATALKILQ